MRDNSDHHGPAWVYRVYDVWGRLIYVGATLDLPSRLNSHRTNAWWARQVGSVKATVHPTKGEARRVEAAAIAEEKPRWNRRSRWATRHTWTAADYDDYITAHERSGSTNAFHIANARAERESLFGPSEAAA